MEDNFAFYSWLIARNIVYRFTKKDSRVSCPGHFFKTFDMEMEVRRFKCFPLFAKIDCTEFSPFQTTYSIEYRVSDLGKYLKIQTLEDVMSIFMMEQNNFCRNCTRSRTSALNLLIPLEQESNTVQELLDKPLRTMTCKIHALNYVLLQNCVQVRDIKS